MGRSEHVLTGDKVLKFFRQVDKEHNHNFQCKSEGHTHFNFNTDPIITDIICIL